MTYGYIRVSTDKQTVENQRLEITEWAAKRSLGIDTWLEQTCSGTKNYKKGEFRDLILTRLLTGDTLIVSELSRLSRSSFEIMEILKTLMDREVNVKTVKEGYELGDNITSKVLAFAFGLSAEIERNLISERTKAGLKRAVMSGSILGRPRGTKNKDCVCSQHRGEIISLIDKGISFSGISRIVGVHRLTIAKYVTKLAEQDLDSRDDAIALAKANRGKFTLENIADLRKKGLNISEIVAFYGMTKTTFYKNLRKLKENA